MSAKWKWAMGLATFAFAPEASAGMFELSFSVAFNRSNYTEVNYSWSRRYGVGLGYYFSELSQIEFAFQDVVARTYVERYEDTTFHDNIYSISIVQSLMPRSAPVQPYVKAGAGQVYRTITGSYSGVEIPRTQVASLTGILGAGIKVKVTDRVGLKTEATSYLVGGALGTWKDNYAISGGLSFYF